MGYGNIIWFMGVLVKISIHRIIFLFWWILTSYIIWIGRRFVRIALIDLKYQISISSDFKKKKISKKKVIFKDNDDINSVTFNDLWGHTSWNEFASLYW